MAHELPANLKDLISIAFDLDFVEDACQKLLDEDKRPQSDKKVVVQALWMSAVVVYARCFGSGTRTPLDKSLLTELAEEHQETHRRIWRERDKYVAHVEHTREEVTAMERLIRTSTNEVVGTQLMFRRSRTTPTRCGGLSL